MHPVASVIDSFGGIARRDQILASGRSGTDITAAVRRGEIRRVRRAHYATPGASRDAVLAVRVGGRLGGLSAARSYGVWGGFDDDLHVVVTPNASRLRVVRSATDTTPDLDDHPLALHWVDAAHARECWRVPLLEALRQVARWCDPESALAALDTAVDLGLTSGVQLRAAFSGEPISSRLRAASARPGSGSGYESIVVRRLEALGLRVRQQVWIAGVGRIDAEVEDAVLIEVDGFEFHRSLEAFEADRIRDAGLAARDRVVVRLGTRRIREDWNGCLADILDALSFRLPAFRFQEILVRRAAAEASRAAAQDTFTTNS